MIRCLAAACGLLLLTGPSICTGELTPRTMAGAGHFSEDIFNMLFSHPIDDSEHVTEQIKRATTSGESSLVGGVEIDVVRDDSRGRIDFLLQGDAEIPHATAVQRQVRVYTKVESHVDARKSVYFDQDQLADRSATARCPTSIQIRGVQANRTLIARLATRRAYRDLAEVEGIVAQRTSRRIRNRLNERIGAAMESFESRLVTFLRFEEAGFALFPPEVSFKSTDDHLQLWIEAQSGTTVARPADASCLDASLDIQLVLHQQVFAGFATYRMAGRRVQDEEVLKMVEMTRGNAPWSLWVHDRRPRWSVQLASPQPLDVRIADGNLYTSIALDEFQYGPDVLPGPILIHLTLRPEVANDGPRLHRLEGPDVRLDRASRPAAVIPAESQIEQRLARVLRQKFEGIFPEYAYFDRMQAPAGGSWDKVRSLQLERLTAENEWFEIGYRFQDAAMTQE